jgi:ABC-2 type transport system ATP-binding protein/lipopolysaccharide transport system ATP-binding protein
MPAIELQHVSVCFPIYEVRARSLASTLISHSVGARLNRTGNHISVPALQDINLTVHQGERIALIGPNGSGKSTLLQTIAGVYVPQRGQVNVVGQVSPLFNAMLGMSSDATGSENISDRAKLFGISRRELAERLPELRAITGLGDYLQLPVRSYSAGMRARLAFAMSLLLRPDIFLVDEWIGFVDYEFSLIAEAKIRDMAEHAGIMLLASHNENLIERLCTRGILLRQGRIEYDGDALEALRIYYKSRS